MHTSTFHTSEDSLWIEINDVMRFFGRANPEQQFGSGQQHGGRYGCSGCNSLSKRYYDLIYCFHATFLSIADQQKVILSGYFGSTGRNGGIRPFNKLHIEELKKELRSKGVEPIGHKKDLEAMLKELLGGV